MNNLDIMTEHFKIRDEEIQEAMEKGKLKVFYVDGLKFEKIGRGYKVYGKALDGKIKCLVDLVYISSENILDFRRYEYLGEDLEQEIEHIAKADFLTGKYANDPRYSRVDNQKREQNQGKKRRKFSLKKLVVLGTIAGISLGSLSLYNINKDKLNRNEIVNEMSDEDYEEIAHDVSSSNVLVGIGSEGSSFVEEAVEVEAEEAKVVLFSNQVSLEDALAYMEKSLGELRDEAEIINNGVLSDRVDSLYLSVAAPAYSAYYRYLELQEEGLFQESIENARQEFRDCMALYEDTIKTFGEKYEFANFYQKMLKEQSQTQSLN